MKRFSVAGVVTFFGILLFLTGIGFSQSGSPRAYLPVVFTAGSGQLPTPTSTLIVIPPTATVIATQTYTATPTTTHTAVPTATPKPPTVTSTPTLTPTATKTPLPTATKTLVPTTTNTPTPMNTATPLPPANTGNVRITKIFFDGQIFQTEDDEYVQIQNIDTRVIRMNGWTLEDIGPNHTYTFGNFEIAPDQVCRVYTNQNHPDWCGLNWGHSHGAIWNNSGDKATLKDGSGTVIHTCSYSGSGTSVICPTHNTK